MRLNPCIESLKDMKPVDGGRYCGSCAKTIVDLTDKSNDEIRNLYHENNGELCGIVKPNQLRENKYYHPLKRFALALIIVFGTSLFVFANKEGFNQFRNKAYSQLQTSDIKLVVRGYVFNAGAPLVGAEVVATVNGLEYVAYTNVNGEFILSLPKVNADEIELKYVYAGCQTMTKTFQLSEGSSTLFAGRVSLEKELQNCIKGKVAIDPKPGIVEPVEIQKTETFHRTAGTIALPPEPIEEIDIQSKGEVIAPLEGEIEPDGDDIFD